MVKNTSFCEDNLVEKELCKLFPPEWLRDKAKETGLTKRGIIVGGAIGYSIEKQRQPYEERTRQVNEVKSTYSQVAFLLLKRYKNSETEKMDDVFLQSLVDIMLCDDKHDPINKSMIVLTNDSWNEAQKYNLIRNKIRPEMRTRLKELEEDRAKSRWRYTLDAPDPT